MTRSRQEQFSYMRDLNQQVEDAWNDKRAERNFDSAADAFRMEGSTSEPSKFSPEYWEGESRASEVDATKGKKRKKGSKPQSVPYFGWQRALSKREPFTNTSTIYLALLFGAAADEKGEVIHYSNTRLMEESAQSKRTIERNIALICSEGWIEKVRQPADKDGRRINWYYLTIPPVKSQVTGC